MSTGLYGLEFPRKGCFYEEGSKANRLIPDFDAPLQTAGDALVANRNLNVAPRFPNSLSWKIHLNSPLSHVTGLMIALKFSALVVTADNGDIVGLVTQRDVLENHDTIEKSPSTTVKDIMKTTVSRNGSLNEDLIVDSACPIEKCAKMLVAPTSGYPLNEKILCSKVTAHL